MQLPLQNFHLKNFFFALEDGQGRNHKSRVK